MMAAEDWRHNLLSREEQQRWKPLEWERYKEERQRYWARCKPQMLRRSCEARGLRADGELGAVRDRLLKTDLDLGITPEDLGSESASSSVPPASISITMTPDEYYAYRSAKESTNASQ